MMKIHRVALIRKSRLEMMKIHRIALMKKSRIAIYREIL